MLETNLTGDKRVGQDVDDGVDYSIHDFAGLLNFDRLSFELDQTLGVFLVGTDYVGVVDRFKKEDGLLFDVLVIHGYFD